MQVTISVMAAALITSTILGATAVTSLQKAFAEPQRCVSEQYEGGFTIMSCIYGNPAGKEIEKENKEECQDAKEQGLVEKCSSSQTGYGVFGNPKLKKEPPPPPK